jgi:membrane-associated protein
MALNQVFDFILNIDKYLSEIVEIFGPLAYLILFMLIFLETGFVLTPFLPGDSLLFVVGVFAAQGIFNLMLISVLLIIAAIVGDSLNYSIGNYLGEKYFEKSRFFRKDYLDKTKNFYRKYGGKTISLARFIPIVRTFAPFVAGVGKMPYKKFLFYNVIGAIIWVEAFVLAGYFFGGIPLVKENFSAVILTIVFVSLIPIIIGIIKSTKNK